MRTPTPTCANCCIVQTAVFKQSDVTFQQVTMTTRLCPDFCCLFLIVSSLLLLIVTWSNYSISSRSATSPRLAVPQTYSLLHHLPASVDHAHFHTLTHRTEEKYSSVSSTPKPGDGRHSFVAWQCASSFPQNSAGSSTYRMINSGPDRSSNGAIGESPDCFTVGFFF